MAAHVTRALLVQDIVRKVRDKFKSLPNDTWTSQKQIFGVDSSDPKQGSYHNCVLRNLVESKVLERMRKFSTWIYRPTQGGWQLLSLLDNFPAEELYRRFGRQTAGAGTAPCRKCGSPIRGKRANATTCKRCDKGTVLPHQVEVKTLVGGSPEGKQLIANQLHLLDRVNKLTAKVDELVDVVSKHVMSTDAHASEDAPLFKVKKGNGHDKNPLDVRGLRRALDILEQLNNGGLS